MAPALSLSFQDFLAAIPAALEDQIIPCLDQEANVALVNGNADNKSPNFLSDEHLVGARYWSMPPMGAKPLIDETTWIVRIFVVEVSSGGSCWGDEAISHFPDVSKPDFWILDAILGSVCPAITYLQYKSLMIRIAPVVRSVTDTEYYGNYTRFEAECFSLRALYDTLLDLGILIAP